MPRNKFVEHANRLVVGVVGASVIASEQHLHIHLHSPLWPSSPYGVQAIMTGTWTGTGAAFRS